MSNMLFPMGFKRQFAGPLDADAVFTTSADLTAYLSDAARYAGMIVTCLETPGVIYVLNNAMDAWTEYKGEKGDTGFSPIPEITTSGSEELLNFIIGYEADGTTPIYQWATGVNIKGSTSTGSGSGTTSFDADFTVVGAEIGTYEDGDVVTAGTSVIDVLKNILTKIINPTYTAPTIVLTTTSTLNVESDTTISPILVTTWSQNDAGTLTAFRVFEDGNEIASDVAVQTPYTVAAAKIVDTTRSYKLEADYGAGAVKQTNTGVDYSVGQITAGTKTSNTLTFKGLRKLFYGADSTSTLALTVSSDIRALTSSILGPATGTSFNIAIPIGAKKVTFAYPDTLQDVSSVVYIEGMNAEVKSIFSKTTVSVVGAEGGNAVNYKVYTYVPASAFTATATYKVTI